MGTLGLRGVWWWWDSRYLVVRKLPSVPAIVYQRQTPPLLQLTHISIDFPRSVVSTNTQKPFHIHCWTLNIRKGKLTWGAMVKSQVCGSVRGTRQYIIYYVLRCIQYTCNYGLSSLMVCSYINLCSAKVTILSIMFLGAYNTHVITVYLLWWFVLMSTYVQPEPQYYLLCS